MRTSSLSSISFVSSTLALLGLAIAGCPGNEGTPDAATRADAVLAEGADARPSESDAPIATSDTPASGDVARCMSIASMVATSCEGQADRTCHHTETAALCATERADVLADALQCLLDSSTGTGSCRTFGDPSGAQGCLDDLAAATDTTDTEPVIAHLVAACPTATEAQFLTMGAIPGMALGAASLDRFDTCITAAADCTGVAQCVNDLFPAISACY